VTAFSYYTPYARAREAINGKMRHQASPVTHAGPSRGRKKATRQKHRASPAILPSVSLANLELDEIPKLSYILVNEE
jgi:hypothetical protein